MPIFDRGTVVRVPFPYTARPVRQRRPALVVSVGGLGDSQELLWVVMITSADNRRWPDDIDLSETHAEVGLPAASLIRPSKIATIEASHAEPLGKVGQDVLDQLAMVMRRHLGP
jgi:mRNA interferase MazF